MEVKCVGVLLHDKVELCMLLSYVLPHNTFSLQSRYQSSGVLKSGRLRPEQLFLPDINKRIGKVGEGEHLVTSRNVATKFFEFL
jgi:hypothetical protein